MRNNKKAFFMLLSLFLVACNQQANNSDLQSPEVSPKIQMSEETKFKKMQSAALEGSAEAQYVLGIFYGRGNGVSKDEIEAEKWLRKAAEQGFADAQSERVYCGSGHTRQLWACLHDRWFFDGLKTLG